MTQDRDEDEREAAGFHGQGGAQDGAAREETMGSERGWVRVGMRVPAPGSGQWKKMHPNPASFSHFQASLLAQCIDSEIIKVPWGYSSKCFIFFSIQRNKGI
jgi:hypothetical protein